MDAQELENLQKSSSTKSQDAGEKTSDQLCFLKFFEFSFITTFVCNFVFYSSKKCIFDNKNPNLIIEKFCIKQQLLLRSYG